MWRKYKRRTIDGQREPVVFEYAETPRRFRSYFGFNEREFRKLCDNIAPVAARMAHKQRRIRNSRKYGAGRPHKCPLLDRVGMALMLLRGHTEEVVGGLFGVSRDTVKAALKELQPVLAVCLETPKKITWKIVHPRKNGDLRDHMQGEEGAEEARMEAVKREAEEVEDGEAAVDATVFNTTKPSDKETYKLLSRRGKGVGLNVMTVVKLSGKIAFLSWPAPASVSDANLYRATRNKNLMKHFERAYTDRAFIGVEDDPRILLVHGDKKPPGGELSEKSLAKNRWINSKKYRVEQANSLIKNFAIVKRMHWYDSRKLYDTLQVVCGLINFRHDERAKRPENWGHGNRTPCKRPRKPRDLELPVRMPPSDLPVAP